MDSLSQRLRDRLAGTDLSIELRTRLEVKAQQTRNERCATSLLFRSGYTCRAPFTPGIDAQFSLLTSGGFSERTRVDVDYDSQREFDGSNAIRLAWQGSPTAWLRRVEVGNVSFAPAPSRFITAGIPSGNVGIQTEARFGPISLTAIAAQQKGNVTRDQVFQVGAGTVRTEQREIEDYQVEPRRFFLTVDPAHLGTAYPNLDLIDGPAMLRLASSLPDTVRPGRVAVYRLILGGQPPNPNGPRFRLLGDPLSRAGQVYEMLRENVDYYLDPSQLWLALVRPLALNNERLVVAYTFRVAGRDTVIARLGGTPDLEFVPGQEQFAHLLWDPQVTPDSPTFAREVRSVYRLGGDDVRRESVQLRIVAGTSAEQEKPAGGTSSTYLQFFGLAQVNNPSTFDAENRLWPRPNDPNFLVAVLPESVVALLGAGLLFVLPTNLAKHEFTLSWTEAVKIDWWIVFLYGGGIALGTLTFKTGLAQAMGNGITTLLGVNSAFALLALSTALATILSETTSNTASANMVIPVVIAFASSAGIDPLLPAVGATMGASLGFMMPVSTPCNAIVYGSGRIPLTRMLRHGIVLDVVGVVTIITVVSLLGPLVLHR